MITVASLCILFVFFGTILLIANVSGSEDNVLKDDSGISFLSSRENLDTSAIEELFKNARREEMIRKYQSGEIDVWSIYNSEAVILGDSRAAGFTWVDGLDSNIVCAAVSNTIYNIPDHYDYIESRNPSMIFITYGMNDIGIWNGDLELWTSELGERVETLRSVAPNATIYMISVFPVLDSDPENYKEIWDTIPEWNEGVEEWCEGVDIKYIDLTYVAEEHKDLYAGDGVHFATEFYTYWGEEMISYAQ